VLLADLGIVRDIPESVFTSFADKSDLDERFKSTVNNVTKQCKADRSDETKQDQIAAGSGTTRNSKDYQRNLQTGDAVTCVAQVILANSGKIINMASHMDIMGANQKIML
jgi:hypothetical protein